MSVNFYTNNGYGKYRQLQKDIKDIKGGVEHVNALEKGIEQAFLFAVPTFRRTSSLNEKLDNGDIIPAVGLLGLAAINAPEDFRDMKAAGKQIRSKIDKNYNFKVLYERKTHQHAFSFFRGTAIEKWLHNKMDKGSKIAEKLYNLDNKTLYETKLGKILENIFGIEELDTSHLVKEIKDIKGNEALASSFKSKRFGGEMTARAMKRLPIIGVMALALLEIPKILSATGKGDNIAEQAVNTVKQTAKSGISLSATLAGVGYGGAIGARYGGATGSLVGMGLGIIAGAAASEKLQDIIA